MTPEPGRGRGNKQRKGAGWTGLLVVRGQRRGEEGVWPDD